MLASRTRYWFAVIQLSLLTASIAFGQATAVVQIAGVVTDPNGAAVPGATVRAIQTETNFVRATTSGADGSYALRNLPTGPYRLEVTADGFKTFNQKGIVLEVNNNPTVNVALELGSLTQTVEVQASASMIETQNTGVSQVIDQRRISELPLNGRQPTQLILLSGAAVVAPPSDLASSKNYPSSTTIAVAGGQANGTYYLLDGADHNDAFSNVNLPLPFPDALQEFSVITNAVPAQYGFRAGGVVNAVTRSGSNSIHGSAFEFVRNGNTNAKNFFGTTRDNLKRNQFGGVVGGPVLKDRVFFFGGYQGTRIRSAPPTTTLFVPNADVLQGNFNTLETGCGVNRTLKNPATGAPFANNQIPTSLFNQQALNILKYVPVSNDPCGKLVIAIPNPQDEDQFIGRGDWTRSTRHSIFGRYYLTDYRNPGVFDGKNLLIATRPGVLDRVQSLALGDTFVFTPNMINSFHITGTRKRVNRGPSPNMIDSATVGLKIINTPGSFPEAAVSGRFAIGCGTCAKAVINNNALQVADDFSAVLGRHQLSFGVNWIHNQLNLSILRALTGIYAFNGSATNDAMSDFLLGSTSSFQEGNPSEINFRQNVFGLYVHDNFRFSNRITIQAGLRWEPYLPEGERFGRLTHFELSNYVANVHSTVFQNAPKGFLFSGEPGMPENATESNLLVLSPRIGISWGLDKSGRTNLRAAYGILYDTPSTQYFDRMSFGPPWTSAIVLTSPVGGFTDPFKDYPGGNPFPTATPPPKSAYFPLSGAYANLPRDIKPSYTQQYNLSLQRQFGGDWLLSVGYLGNHSVHRWVTTQANRAIYIPGASTLANTQQRRLLSQLDPVNGALVATLPQVDDGGTAGYNGLLVSINHRLSRHVSLLANYTWSHCISDTDIISEIVAATYQNPNNRRGDHGNCQTDIRHIFNLSALLQSPEFKGTWTRRVFSGWELSPIITKRSGYWISVVTGTDTSLTAVGLDRPNIVGDVHAVTQNIDHWFNKAAFQANGPGTYGNAGRSIIQGPGAFTFDTALIRRFRLRERMQLEFRAEAFNILNHPVFGNPSISLADANIGRILVANDPRILQGAFRFVF
jgi:hypothetical protein